MSHSKTLKVGTVKFSDIETPKTIEEFRANLKRYFMSFGDDQLYVYCPINGSFGVSYDEIESLSDLYSKSFDPHITPFVAYSSDDLKEFMEKTQQYFSSNGFFADPKTKVNIWNSEKISHSELFKLPLKWFSIDNQVLREFYIQSLGNFSGYVLEEVA